MATWYKYRCEKCGWERTTSPDGHSVLMMGEFDDYLCPDCHEIFQLSHWKQRDTTGQLTLFPRCPKCGRLTLIRWNPVKGRCPKCGGKLQQTGGIILAD